MNNFGETLISWYEKNKRRLPWRQTNDPYKIWVSEVILQQTRVDQGLGYYLRFVDQYPDVFTLANASEKEVFKLWQGLGYYNRAANMLLAAKTIVEDYNGNFPTDPDELIKIRGIGSYTSAAIASLAFGVSIPVVDGNVFRVLSRIFGINTPINSTTGKKEFEKIAAELIHHHNPGVFNQALMEFGALNCKPKSPVCSQCIFKADCFAFSNNRVSFFPVKKQKAVVSKRYLYYFLIQDVHDNKTWVYLKKREEKDIWKNLYDFPLVDSKRKIDPLDALSQFTSFFQLSSNQTDVKNISEIYHHQLTHQKIYAQFITLIVNKKINLNGDNSLLLVKIENLINYPVPRLIERYLHDQGIIK